MISGYKTNWSDLIKILYSKIKYGLDCSTMRTETFLNVVGSIVVYFTKYYVVLPHEKEVKPAYYQSEKTNANKNPKSFDNNNNALLFLEFIDHQIKILMKITFPMAQSMKSASDEEKDRVPFLMPSS